MGGGGRFVKLGHFDKDFVKNTRKRSPAGKHVGDFLLGAHFLNPTPNSFDIYVSTNSNFLPMTSASNLKTSITTVYS